MDQSSPEAVALAILAKAPRPGFAKTRLLPALGPARAAELQARFVARTVETATTAALGPVTLWATPDQNDPTLQEISARFGTALARQPDGDLGTRMLAALAQARGPALVIGTDCPALSCAHLRAAADALRSGIDATVIPAEDGGYVLIGTRSADPFLFQDIPWGTRW